MLIYIDINNLDIEQMSLDYNIDKKFIIKSINKYNRRTDAKVFSNKEENFSMNLEQEIKDLAKKYADNLKRKMDARTEEMKSDDKSHYLVYQVLGVTDEEGHLIDLYQNKGRFLYKYAGSFLEEATKLCFLHKFPESTTTKITNTLGTQPKTFEIDCLEGKNAIEIKWRDATTDGDHIIKENTRINVIRNKGYTPIRVMFYYPNREQAMKIQSELETLYKDIGGQYYYGDSAWEYVKERTGIDLKNILEKIAKENFGA
jgi:ATP-dependent 26S proteasome regulatory subunit